MPLTVKEAASIQHVTVPAIIQAIRIKKLKSKKVGGRWEIDIDDLIAFDRNKFNRDLSIYQDQLKFDPEKGELSVKKAAELSGFNEQHLYHAINYEYIPASKKGGSWVIKIEELERYKQMRKDHRFNNGLRT